MHIQCGDTRKYCKSSQKILIKTKSNLIWIQAAIQFIYVWVVFKVFYWHKENTETGFLNRDCGRKPQVNLRSRARCSNSIGWGIQPDQGRPGTRALDLGLTWGLLPTVLFKESTSGLLLKTWMAGGRGCWVDRNFFLKKPTRWCCQRYLPRRKKRKRKRE